MTGTHLISPARYFLRVHESDDKKSRMIQITYDKLDDSFRGGAKVLLVWRSEHDSQPIAVNEIPQSRLKDRKLAKRSVPHSCSRVQCIGERRSRLTHEMERGTPIA